MTEMMVVALLLVILFPPRELPKMARTVAQIYGRLRKTADDFRSAVMLDDELQEPIREIRNVYHEARFEIRKTQDTLRQEMRQAARDVESAVQPNPEGPLPREAAGAKTSPDTSPSTAEEAGASAPSTDAAPGTPPPRPPTLRAPAGRVANGRATGDTGEDRARTSPTSTQHAGTPTPAAGPMPASEGPPARVAHGANTDAAQEREGA